MEEQLVFADRDEFRKWLNQHCATHNSVWLVFGKTSQLKTLKPDEALEEALCFGWIDGQIKSVDEDRYLKKFAPRRQDSRWSEINRGIAARLIAENKMTGQGLAAIERAQQSGVWEHSKAAPISDPQIEILINDLEGADLALSNFMKMPPSVKRTYTAFYLDAKKEETRKTRLARIIERLNANQKPM